jgi:carbon monoxide dehydrogenase subunit G
MMELADEIVNSATLDTVYASLNDIEILKKCIPGCQELVAKSETELVAIVVLKIGPIKANFNGTVVLDQRHAPQFFSLSGQGDGGVAGFARGGADVELVKADANTVLKYTAKAEISGKIAQLGNRLITSTAKKLSKQFFSNFEAEMAGDETAD